MCSKNAVHRFDTLCVYKIDNKRVNSVYLESSFFSLFLNGRYIYFYLRLTN